MAQLLERLVRLEAVHAIGEAQQRWPVRLLVMFGLLPHILRDDLRKENVPPPVLVPDRFRKALHSLHLELHCPRMSVRGDPSTAHGSNDRTEASIWHRDAGSAPGRSGTG